MLCLKWNFGETLKVGDAVIKFTGWRKGGIRIVVDAPKSVAVVRGSAKNKEPKDAAERIEREQKAAAERKAAQERAEAAERARIEAARPDVEKIHELADDIDGIGFPDVSDGNAKLFLAEIHEALEALAERCREFKV